MPEAAYYRLQSATGQVYTAMNRDNWPGLYRDESGQI